MKPPCSVTPAQHRCHAELAHAEADVVTRVLVVEVFRAGPEGEIRSGQVGRAAEELRQARAVRVECILRGLARGDRFRLRCRRRERALDETVEIFRQLSRHPAQQLACERRMRLRVALEALIPLRLDGAAALPRVPGLVHRLRNFERRIRPADRLARRCDLLVAERRAVRVVRVGLVRGALRDDGLAADHRGSRIGARGDERRLDLRGVVPVDVRHDVPAVGLEALRRVIGEPGLDVAVDRDAVVVVETDELAELERARERAGLVRDAFHEAAVAEEHVGAVIDDLVARTVELRGEHAFGERHADRVRQALSERARRRLDAGRETVFRVARRPGMDLAKALDLLHREVIAGEMQQGVEQHRAVAVREHEAVAVDPLRIGRVVAQVAAPQHLGDLGHAHRHARMAGVRLLHGVHRQRPYHVHDVAAACAGCDRLRWSARRGSHSSRVRSSFTFRRLQAHMTKAKTGTVQATSALRRRSISRRIMGVKMSCIASSILPPGATMVFGRDMNES
jgi:hypothetical protein